MERRLAFLGTLGANAPFIGLLGTVIGIIRAFAELNEAAGKVTAGLMTEVGEALVATAIGIMVAIPAIAVFNAYPARDQDAHRARRIAGPRGAGVPQVRPRAPERAGGLAAFQPTATQTTETTPWPPPLKTTTR